MLVESGRSAIRVEFLLAIAGTAADNILSSCEAIDCFSIAVQACKGILL